MGGLVRILALAVFAGALGGCITDGMIGAEVEEAKPRVIDTAKTKNAAQKDAAKKEAAKKEAAKNDATTRSVETAQGDTAAPIVTARIEPEARQPEAAPNPEAPTIPARTLFGNWTLGQEGGGNPCRLILGGVPIGSAYAARGEADCPKAFSSVQTWEIQGDALVLRNQSRAVIGRLQPTGPSRFDGQAEGGGAVYLVR